MATVQTLRILSYNVRYFGHATRGLATTKKAMKRIADAIASLKPLPAIVCLQEVETRSLRSTVAHRTASEATQLEQFLGMLAASLADAGKPSDAFEAYYFPAHAYRLSERTKVYTTGLAILAHSDFTVDHHNAGTPHDITHRRLHAVRRIKQTRICAHVRFRHRTQRAFGPIDVFNTHLSLPSTLSKAFWTEPRRMGWGPNQLEEAKNLVRFVEQERASDRFVVVGDFNALPGSPVYEHLVAGPAWVDAFAHRYKLGVEELVSWPTAGFMRMRMHLDHVFAGRGIRWLDFDETHPYGDRTAPFHGLSDHMPMVARCRVARGDTIPPT
ncbi:MAG TPA: endonuclease/exonuclease/phosphatase family protein [Polyangiaceae bacterium]|nr:endonuclease/exonuclease/phosphatase family protein [Polyangiaceae bacterium]